MGQEDAAVAIAEPPLQLERIYSDSGHIFIATVDIYFRSW